MIYLDNASTLCPKLPETIAAQRVAGTSEAGLLRRSSSNAAAAAEGYAVIGAGLEIAGNPADYRFTEWEGHHAR